MAVAIAFGVPQSCSVRTWMETEGEEAPDACPLRVLSMALMAPTAHPDGRGHGAAPVPHGKVHSPVQGILNNQGLMVVGEEVEVIQGQNDEDGPKGASGIRMGGHGSSQGTGVPDPFLELHKRVGPGKGARHVSLQAAP